MLLLEPIPPVYSLSTSSPLLLTPYSYLPLARTTVVYPDRNHYSADRIITLVPSTPHTQAIIHTYRYIHTYFFTFFPQQIAIFFSYGFIICSTYKFLMGLPLFLLFFFQVSLSVDRFEDVFRLHIIIARIFGPWIPPA